MCLCALALAVVTAHNRTYGIRGSTPIFRGEIPALQRPLALTRPVAAGYAGPHLEDVDSEHQAWFCVLRHIAPWACVAACGEARGVRGSAVVVLEAAWE